VNGRARRDMVQTSDFRGREVLSVMAIYQQLRPQFPSCRRSGTWQSLLYTAPLITGKPHGDMNQSHICDLGVMRRASQWVSPATTRYGKSVVLAQTKLDGPYSRAADAKIDDFMTVPRSLPGRREAGPTARTARLSHLYPQRRLHRRELFLRDRGRA
jgi:hypothetical protein